MLPEPVIEKLKYDYQTEADLASARGAADQLNLRDQLEAELKKDPSDPWETLRGLMK